MSEINSVPFWIPINFEERPKNWSETLLEAADHYFYLGGRSACVIADPNEKGSYETTYRELDGSLLTTVLKVISYITLVIPLIVLIAKAILRNSFQFHLDQSSCLFGLDGAAKAKKLEEILGEGISDQAVAALKAFKTSESLDDSNLIGTDKFSLNDYPNVEFQRIDDRLEINIKGEYTIVKSAKQIAEEEIARRAKVKQFCLDQHLDLLYLPSSKLTSVDYQQDGVDSTDYYIATEEIDLGKVGTSFNYSGLKKSIRQLTTFMVKYGFNHLLFSNVIDIDQDFKGDRRITVGMPTEVKEEERLAKAAHGIFAEGFGLVDRLPTAELVEAVIAEAEKQGITDYNRTPTSEIKEMRLSEITAKEELESDIQLTDALKAALQNAFSTNFKGIQLSHIDGERQFFRLPDFPEYIFTIAKDQEKPISNQERPLFNDYANAVRAQQICSELKFDRLFIMHQKFVKIEVAGEKRPLLISRTFESSESANHHFKNKPEDLEPVRQLANFIVEANYGIENQFLFVNSKIVIDQVEEMNMQDGAALGILGAPLYPGLISILYTKAQIDIALDALRSAGIEAWYGNNRDELVSLDHFKKERLRALKTTK
jgi:hypothetical protein